jgi:hypothetical protein
MELSRSHRFIFVHVYRSGGQSVTAALEPYLTRPRLARIRLLRRLGDWRLDGLRAHHHGHISARYLDWRVNTAGPELQSDFVCDASGDLLVDFLGHYETLAVDFAQVCARLGISRALPHKNRSQHHNYLEYYSAETRALVADAYRADIERFGYEFEGQKSLAPIVAFRAQR